MPRSCTSEIPASTAAALPAATAICLTAVRVTAARAIARIRSRTPAINARNAAHTVVSITGIHDNDAPNVAHALLNAHAISAAEIANVEMICNLVYSISVPVRSESSPNAAIASAN